MMALNNSITIESIELISYNESIRLHLVAVLVIEKELIS
jgi:hypothetical protein